MNKIFLTIGILLIIMGLGYSQSLKVVDPITSVAGEIGTQIHSILKLKNESEKPINIEVYILEKQIGSSQNTVLCYNDECYEEVDKLPVTILVEPGETIETFEAILSAGQSERFSTVVYRFANLDNPDEFIDYEVNYSIEEKRKELLYQKDDTKVGTLYPNPVREIAMIDYSLTDESKEIKIVLHNVLGSKVDEFKLLPFETQLKIYTSEYNPGVYFYTLYIDNEGIATKKMIVRR